MSTFTSSQTLTTTIVPHQKLMVTIWFNLKSEQSGNHTTFPSLFFLSSLFLVIMYDSK